MEYLKIFELYNQLLKDIKNIKQLAVITKKSISKLGGTHSKLKKKITGEMKFDEKIKDMYELLKDLSKSYKIIEKLKK